MNFAVLNFDRFVWRFGQLVAVFYSAGLLEACGRNPGVKLAGPLKEAKVVFMNRLAVEDHRKRLREDNLNTEEVEFVLERWPSRADETNVEGHTYGRR